MIILHFDLQPQFKYMNYFIYTWHHFTPHGRYELNKLASLPMCGFIAQLAGHRTGIAEVTGSNPVEALIFFQASSFQLLKLENLLRWSFFTLTWGFHLQFFWHFLHHDQYPSQIIYHGCLENSDLETSDPLKNDWNCKCSFTWIFIYDNFHD